MKSMTATQAGMDRLLQLGRMYAMAKLIMEQYVPDYSVPGAIARIEEINYQNRSQNEHK